MKRDKLEKNDDFIAAVLEQRSKNPQSCNSARGSNSGVRKDGKAFDSLLAITQSLTEHKESLDNNQDAIKFLDQNIQTRNLTNNNDELPKISSKNVLANFSKKNSNHETNKSKSIIIKKKLHPIDVPDEIYQRLSPVNTNKKLKNTTSVPLKDDTPQLLKSVERFLQDKSLLEYHRRKMLNENGNLHNVTITTQNQFKNNPDLVENNTYKNSHQCNYKITNKNQTNFSFSNSKKLLGNRIPDYSQVEGSKNLCNFSEISELNDRNPKVIRKNSPKITDNVFPKPAIDQKLIKNKKSNQFDRSGHANGNITCFTDENSNPWVDCADKKNFKSFSKKLVYHSDRKAIEGLILNCQDVTTDHFNVCDDLDSQFVLFKNADEQQTYKELNDKKGSKVKADVDIVVKTENKRILKASNGKNDIERYPNIQKIKKATEKSIYKSMDGEKIFQNDLPDEIIQDVEIKQTYSSKSDPKTDFPVKPKYIQKPILSNFKKIAKKNDLLYIDTPENLTDNYRQVEDHSKILQSSLTKESVTTVYRKQQSPILDDCSLNISAISCSDDDFFQPFHLEPFTRKNSRIQARRQIFTLVSMSNKNIDTFHIKKTGHLDKYNRNNNTSTHYNTNIKCLKNFRIEHRKDPSQHAVPAENIVDSDNMRLNSNTLENHEESRLGISRVLHALPINVNKPTKTLTVIKAVTKDHRDSDIFSDSHLLSLTSDQFEDTENIIKIFKPIAKPHNIKKNDLFSTSELFEDAENMIEVHKPLKKLKNSTIKYTNLPLNRFEHPQSAIDMNKSKDNLYTNKPKDHLDTSEINILNNCFFEDKFHENTLANPSIMLKTDLVENDSKSREVNNNNQIKPLKGSFRPKSLFYDLNYNLQKRIDLNRDYQNNENSKVYENDIKDVDVETSPKNQKLKIVSDTEYLDTHGCDQEIRGYKPVDMVFFRPGHRKRFLFSTQVFSRIKNDLVDKMDSNSNKHKRFSKYTWVENNKVSTKKSFGPNITNFYDKTDSSPNFDELKLKERLLFDYNVEMDSVGKKLLTNNTVNVSINEVESLCKNIQQNLNKHEKIFYNDFFQLKSNVINNQSSVEIKPNTYNFKIYTEDKKFGISEEPIYSKNSHITDLKSCHDRFLSFNSQKYLLSSDPSTNIINSSRHTIPSKRCIESSIVKNNDICVVESDVNQLKLPVNPSFDQEKLIEQVKHDKTGHTLIDTKSYFNSPKKNVRNLDCNSLEDDSSDIVHLSTFQSKNNYLGNTNTKIKKSPPIENITLCRNSGISNICKLKFSDTLHINKFHDLTFGKGTRGIEKSDQNDSDMNVITEDAITGHKNIWNKAENLSVHRETAENSLLLYNTSDTDLKVSQYTDVDDNPDILSPNHHDFLNSNNTYREKKTTSTNNMNNTNSSNLHCTTSHISNLHKNKNTTNSHDSPYKAQNTYNQTDLTDLHGLKPNKTLPYKNTNSSNFHNEMNNRTDSTETLGKANSHDRNSDDSDIGVLSNPQSKKSKTSRNTISKNILFFALRRVFGLEDFRPGQLDCINAIISNRDVFVVMPTGGGKSLLYQLPALLSPGLTIVISPLISLIEDQTRLLLSIGVIALSFGSNLNVSDRRCVLSCISSSPPICSLLFVTPEALLSSNSLQSALKTSYENSHIQRVVLDEAHCVFQWGHDFRPDYVKVGVFLRKMMPRVPFLAVTATAPPTVRLKIQEILGMERCVVFSFLGNRPNLRYRVIPKEKNPDSQIAALIQSNLENDDYSNDSELATVKLNITQDLALITKDVAKNGIGFKQKTEFSYFKNTKPSLGIVYCGTQRETEICAANLNALNIKTQFYHAGLSKLERSKITKGWGKTHKVITATIAFGMGINNKDVKIVIHRTIPQSMEAYAQESGRAGRNNQEAECVILYDQRDIQTVRRLFSDNTAAFKKNKEKYLQEVIAYCEEKKTCRRKMIMQAMGETFDGICELKCDNCERPGQGFDMTVHAVDIFSLIQNSSKKMTLKQTAQAYSSHLRANGGRKVDLPKIYDIEKTIRQMVIMGILREKTIRNRAGYTNTYIENTNRSMLRNCRIEIYKE